VPVVVSDGFLQAAAACSKVCPVVLEQVDGGMGGIADHQGGELAGFRVGRRL
jgi:hypothetical protein